jgi:hypothetical protein
MHRLTHTRYSSFFALGLGRPLFLPTNESRALTFTRGCPSGPSFPEGLLLLPPGWGFGFSKFFVP